MKIPIKHYIDADSVAVGEIQAPWQLVVDENGKRYFVEVWA